MASPVQSPPVQPRAPRSLAGAVVLILLGIVFLMGTMGVLDWHNLGFWFARYWPALIILWGVIKLVEYQNAQRRGTRYPGIGAGGIFLLIVLIVCGLVATQAARVNWGMLRDEINIDNGDFPLWGHTFSYDDQLQQDFPAGATLNVNSDRGAVTVNTSDDKQIHVTIRKRVAAENQQDADKWNTETKPQITVSGNTVILNANTQGAGDHWVSTDMIVAVPRKAAVNVSNRRGDISVNGRDGNVDLSSQRGDVSANDINGNVNLNLDHSSARVSQVSSDVTIQGRANDVSVEDVKGMARLSGEFMESVKLARIAKGASFKSSRTDLEIGQLNGDLDLDSGDLRANDMVGPVRLETRSKDIRLIGVNGDVRLRDQNGDVEIHMNKLGSVQVDNRRGDVQLYVPEKASFQVEARGQGGEIQSDFSQLKIDNGHQMATASGSVGSGGPRIVVNNEHGTIEIRRGTAVAQLPEPPVPPKAPHLKAPEEIRPADQ